MQAKDTKVSGRVQGCKGKGMTLGHMGGMGGLTLAFQEKVVGHGWDHHGTHKTSSVFSARSSPRL